MPFQRVAEDSTKANFISLRKPTAIIGALALASWYFAFVMNFVPELSPHMLLIAFAILLSLVSVSAALWDKSLHTKN
jgi:hypothetical protein